MHALKVWPLRILSIIISAFTYLFSQNTYKPLGVICNHCSIFAKCLCQFLLQTIGFTNNHISVHLYAYMVHKNGFIAYTDMKHTFQKSKADLYWSIIESQNELICRFLPDTTLTFVNSSYCKAFGKTEKELIGTKFIDLIPVGQKEQSLNMIQQLSPENPIITNTHDAILADGSIGWQEWTDVAFFDKKGNILEIQGVGRDITKYKNIENSLRKSLKLEKQMTDLKTRLLYMTSHEFKMPLSEELLHLTGH